MIGHKYRRRIKKALAILLAVTMLPLGDIADSFALIAYAAESDHELREKYEESSESDPDKSDPDKNDSEKIDSNKISPEKGALETELSEKADDITEEIGDAADEKTDADPTAALNNIAEPVEIVLRANLNDEGDACLEWMAPTEGVKAYRIYRDEALIAVLEDDSDEAYTDSATQGGKIYSYRVIAIDADNNEVAISNSAELTIPDALVIASDYVLQEDMTAFSLTLNAGKLDLNGHSLFLQKDYVQNGGTLFFNGGELVCKGNYTVAKAGTRVIMNDINDYLYVGKNVSLQNSDGNYYGEYSAGIMEVAGDFSTSGRGNFAPQNLHMVVLSGEGRQNIALGNNSYFQNLLCNNYSEEGIHSEEGFVCKECNIDENTNVYIGERKVSPGFTLKEDMVLSGDYVLGLGQLDLNGHKLTIEGDFLQAGGTVAVNGGELTVTGDYILAGRFPTEGDEGVFARSGGILRMTQADDTVLVEGDFVTAATADHTGFLTDGVLEVRGDFLVDSAYSEKSFVATQKHKVLFSGTGKQEVSFGASLADRSRFADLEIRNNGEDGVNFRNDNGVYPLVTGTVEDHDSKVTGGIAITGSTVTADPFAGDLYVVQGANLTEDVAAEGSLYIRGGSVYLRSDLKVDGSVYIGEDGYGTAMLYVCGGTLTIGGNLELKYASYKPGFCLNDNRGGKIHVKGSLLGSNGTIQGSYGELELEGDVRVTGTFQMSGSNKVILSGTGLQTVSIPDNGYFATVELQNYSEEGVYSEKVFGRNLLVRNGCRLTYGEMKGAFGWTLDKDEVYEGDLVLLDDVLDLNGHKLTVEGDLIQSAGEIKISGGRLEVRGDYRIQSRTSDGEGGYIYGKSGGILRMTQEKDYVCIGGSFVTASTADHTGLLTDGVLEVGGDFLVDSAYSEKNFVATQKHKVLFSGAGKQEISFGISRADRSRFAELEIRNTGEDGVSFRNDNGVYPLVTGTVADHDSKVTGGIAIAGSTVTADPFAGDLYVLQDMNITGDVAAEGSLYIRGGRVYLYSEMSVGGSVCIGEDGYLYSMLYVCGGTLTVGGDLELKYARYKPGLYFYDNRGGKIHVKGSLLGSNSTIQASYGELEVEGDVRVTGTFQMSGRNKVILSGTGLQTVSIPDDGYFATIELRNHSKDGIYSEKVFGRNLLVRNGCRLTYGEIEGEFGWILDKDEVYEGDLILLDDVLDLNGHKLTVKGDLIQNAGEIKVSGGRLEVRGDYRIQSRASDGEDGYIYGKSGGVLRMTQADDTVVVKGDFVTATTADHSGLLTDGVLEVRGDFLVDSAYSEKSFVATQKHKVLFSGMGKQEVSFGASSADRSRFADLEIRNTCEDGVSFRNENGVYPLVTGTVEDHDSKVTGGIAIIGSTVTADPFAGDLYALRNIDITRNLATEGSLYIKGCYVYLYSDLNVGASVYIEGDGYRYAALYMCGGRLTVEGDLELQYAGYRASLCLYDNRGGKIHVKGNLLGSNGAIQASYGELEVEGDVRVTGMFQMSGSNKVILSGKGLQTVSIPDDGYFATVELQNHSKEGVCFTKNYPYERLVRNGCKISIPGMVWQYGRTLENDEVWDGDFILYDDELDLNGHSFTVTGNLIQIGGTININKGTLSVNGDFRIQNIDKEGDTVSYRASSGKLLMREDEDRVIVHGDFILQPFSDTKGWFTNGKLELYGNFTQIGSRGYQANGKNTILFLGNDRQELTFSAATVFANITNKNNKRLVLNSDLSAAGTIRDEGNNISGPGFLCVNRFDQIENGSYSGNITIASDCVMKQDFVTKGTLRLDKQVHMQGHRIDTGSLDIHSTLWMEKATISCSGDCNISEYGLLVMREPEDFVLVNGNMLADTRRSHEGYLTDGVLEIRGNFIQKDYTNFIASGAHTAILSRKRVTTARDFIQTISFQKDAGITRFNRLVLKKTQQQYRFTNSLNEIANEVIYDIEDINAPSSVEYILAEVVTETKVELLFDGAEDDTGILGYEIHRNGKIVGVTSSKRFRDTSVTPDTTYTYTVYAFDQDRNLAAQSPFLQVKTKADTETPTVPAGLFINTRTGSSVTLGWTAARDNVKVAGYIIYCDGEAVGEHVTTNSFTISGLEARKVYRCQVAAYDTSGNISEKSAALEAVVAEPKITRVFPEDHADIGGNTVDVTVYFKNVGNSKGNKVTIEFLNEDGEWADLCGHALSQQPADNLELCAKYTWNISDLNEEKNYFLKVTLCDADGNKATKSLTYFVDRKAPEVPAQIEAAGDDGTVRLHWLPSVSADCQGYHIFRKSAEKENYVLVHRADGRFETNYTDPDVTEGSAYRYVVTAWDTFGNESAYSEEAQVLVEQDTVCPVVKSLSAGSGRVSGKVSVEAAATDNKKVAAIGLQYRAETESKWRELAKCPAEEGKIQYQWDTAALEDGVYYLNAYAIDAKGNVSKDAFFKKYEIDNTGIQKIRITDTEVHSSYVKLQWEDVTEKDFAFFQIEQVRGEECVVLGTETDKLGYYIKNLAPQTTYTFRVVGYDDLGNRGIPSDEIHVRTGEDVTAPYITGTFPASSRYRDVLSLAVTAKDDDAVSRAVFSYSLNGTDFTEIETVSAEEAASSVRLGCEFNVSRLPEGKLYVKFEVYDKSGNKSLPTNTGKDVIVEYIIDRTAPEAVKNIRVADDAGAVELAWDAPAQEEKDVRAYRVYRADHTTGIYSLIEKECATRNYFDYTAKVGDTYLYKVSAVDLAGNEGPCSAEVIATVTQDTQAPKITGITPGEGETVCADPSLKILAMDNAGLYRIEVEYQPENDPDVWFPIASIDAQGGIFLAETVWDTQGLKEGAYKIRATATDIYGNVGEPAVVNIRLDLSAPALTKAYVETGHFETILHMECGEAEDFAYFEIRRRDPGSEEWKTVTRTAQTVCRDTFVEPGIVYFYQILAYDRCGNIARSAELPGYADDLDVENPVAIAAENIIGLTGMEIMLDGTGSTDNVHIVEYRWDMDNGDILYGTKPRYTYREKGEYRVTLTVKDAAGNTDSTLIPVHIYDKTGRGKSTVHVVDEKGCGIPHALIYMKLDAGNYMSLKTDDDGYIDLVAEIGAYTVAAYQKGYLPADLDVVFNEYEEKFYTLTLTEEELVTGNLEVRRATLEEMLEAGVDFSDPNNYYSYVFKVDLTFERRNYTIEYILNGWDDKHNAVVWGEGGETGGSSLLIGMMGHKDDAGDAEPEPVLAYLSTTQSVSWLKDMYCVELGILNAADTQYSIIDSKAALNLPAGVSLASTERGQSPVKNMGEISGQERKSVSWIVKGDKRGTYSLDAYFTGILMPFGEDVSAHFESETEFEVTAGQGVRITIMPEAQAHIGEDYYIQFAITNESDHPLYNFSTSIGAYQEPDRVSTYKDVLTGEEKVVTTPVTISDPAYISSAVVMHKGQMVTFRTLYPGQTFYGTYVTTFLGNADDDPEKHYYELVDALAECLSEDNYGVTLSISPIASHIDKVFYEVVDLPSYYGDPVDLTTGFFTDAVTALGVQGASPLGYDLSYLSGMTDAAGQMGYGWYSDYEMKLENHNGLVRFYRNPSCSMLFFREEALTSAFYGRMEGDELIVCDDEKYTYGDYVCVNGSRYDCKLTRKEDGAYTMQLPSGGRYEFDREGRLTAIYDGEGRSVSLSYKDNTITITETATGKQLYLKQDGEGLVTSVSDQAGRETSFSYDEQRNMTAITLPNGDTIRYTYDERHRITAESNANGVFVRNVYDDAGRVTSQKDALGNEITFDYEETDTDTTVTVTDAEGISKKAVVNRQGKITKYVNEDGGETKYYYDRNGNLLIEKDAKGNAIYREYDENGNQVKFIDKGGLVTTMTYDAAGNVTTITAANGHTAVNTYDSNNRLVSMKDYNGLTTTYEYNEAGQVVKQTTDGIGSVIYGYTDGLVSSVTDYKGNVTRSEYDAAGNMTKMTDAAGNVTLYEYDLLGRTTCVKYADGSSERYTYNCNGNITSVTDGKGRTIRSSYDAAGNLLVQEYADGTATTYTYNKNGNCIKEEYADGTCSLAEYDVCGNRVRDVFADGTQMTYTYDLLGQRTAETDNEGNTLTYAYYPNGNLHKVVYPDGGYELYTYNQNWKVIGVADKSGNSVSYAYDAMGNCILERDALGNSYAMEYDALGRLVKETDPNGNETTYTYDVNSNCIEKTNALGVSVHMEYDALNRMTGAYTVSKDGTEYRVSYTYDAMGRVTSSTDEEGNATTFSYDDQGNLVSMKDACGNVTAVSAYDSMGRVAAVTDALGSKTVYQYDKVGNLTKTVQSLNGESRETAYTYDAMGRMTGSSENGSVSSRVTYDTRGNVVSAEDAMGGVTRYSYDSCSRLVKEISPLGNATCYAYNAEGLLSEMTNARSQKSIYTYDAMGRVISMKDELGTVDYTYDKNGNVLTVSDAKGTITRKYDALDRVTEYTDYNGNTVKYGYDELGNMISLTYPGGEVVRYRYYKNGWLQSVVDAKGRTTSYTYDGNGNQLTCTRPNGTKEICTYNSDGLLIAQRDIRLGADGQEEAELSSFTYSYDGWGNITSVTGTETAATAEGIAALQSATFAYDAQNRLIRYNGEEVRYDADGNMTYGPVNGKMTELTYDCRNRLVSAGGMQYTYDAENNRLAAESDTWRETYVTDTVSSSLSRVLVMTRYEKGDDRKNSSGGVRTIYVYGSGLISEEQGDILLYHHYNNLGSTVKLTDGDGNVAASYTYGVYGELLSGDTTLTRYLYNGRCGVSTDENGLYYMRQRYYNPEIKRFINQDILTGSIGNSQSLNRYSYVQGNPVSYTDPFGLSPLSGLFTGTGFAHGVLGILGCVPGAVGIVANLVDAGIYCFVDKDYAMAGWCLLSAATMGFGSIAKTAAVGSRLARGAEYLYVAGNLISNTRCFVQSGVQLVDTGFTMYDKYVVNKQQFDITDNDTRNELITLGLSAIGVALSVPGMTGNAVKLADMMYEDQIVSRLKNMMVDNAARMKCGVMTKVTGTIRCFVAGTLVATRDGNKPIEEIEIGDEVWAYDEETGETGYKRVTKTFVNETSTIVHLIIDGEVIDTTLTHPFYVPGYGFKPACELSVGEKVQILDGGTKSVDGISIETLVQPVKVYNFEVEDWHTYYVGMGNVLVHNMCELTSGDSYVIEDDLFISYMYMEEDDLRIDFMAEYEIHGKCLFLKDAVMYTNKGNQANQVGTARIMKWLKNVSNELYEKGFRELRITATRVENSSSANPGMNIDRLFRLGGK